MAKKKPTRRKTPTISQLKRRADKVFSVWIRHRDMGVCITCDGIGNQAGHFMSRRFSSTRFHEQNVNGQCQKCNIWNHGEQFKYAIALDKKYGEGTALKLAELAQEHHHFTPQELQEIIDKYK